MRIGIRDGCLQMSWPEALKAAAEIGFDGVELDIGPDYRDTLLWREGPEAVAKMAEDAGGKILSFCAGVCWGISPASADLAVREEIRTLLRDLSTYSGQLGAGFILVPITPGGEDVTYEDSVARWIEQMKLVAPAAEDAGVVLCLENVGRGVGKSAQELITLVDGVGSRAVQAYYDIGNATAFGNDPVAEIRQLGSRIADVHIKDYKGELLGAGQVNIAGSVAALKEIGYSDDLVFETAATDDPRAAAKYNLDFLKGLL
jgi:sugar phosphate isomerase/epimerase